MRDTVKNYYGSVLQDSNDLKTNTCTTANAPPRHLAQMLGNVHDEVRARYYGCGLVYPALLAGTRVLDLGCGAGRDCYVLAQLVGANGGVVGVDMTDEQLEIARRHTAWHMSRFGYTQVNVDFRKAYIEELDELDLPSESFDAIVSNCVINLAIDKPAVLRQAYALLKTGGEMYFSDVYAAQRVPLDLARDPVLYGECLSGALYWNDFENMARRTGFSDPRLVEDSAIEIRDADIAARIGHIDFYSATYRLFKLPQLEPACEDYGQVVIYRGTIPNHPEQFLLDKHHVFQRGRALPVCGNTWRMLHDTRFQTHFEFVGDWSTHYGIFEGCGAPVPFAPATQASPTAGACC